VNFGVTVLLGFIVVAIAGQTFTCSPSRISSSSGALKAMGTSNGASSA